MNTVATATATAIATASFIDILLEAIAQFHTSRFSEAG